MTGATHPSTIRCFGEFSLKMPQAWPLALYSTEADAIRRKMR
jgi:hypothetical protein